jgi:hypothetical protein
MALFHESFRIAIVHFAFDPLDANEVGAGGKIIAKGDVSATCLETAKDGTASISEGNAGAAGAVGDPSDGEVEFADFAQREFYEVNGVAGTDISIDAPSA